MITAKIENTLKKYNMLNAGDTVAVGVSGGADSMLLLSYLVSNSEKLGITVIAANVEHGIRGEASVKDSEFVREWCEKNGVEFRGISINAPAEAKAAGEGVEEYSRKRRYEFFKSLDTEKIATAHNLSDNVETVLFRLARGTSIKGLCGIPPVRDNIVRPLIECTSEEIRAYCKENGIPFVVDETNGDNAYSRNYIRNEIIPALKKLNPSLEAAVTRCIASANEAQAVLEAEACNITFPAGVEELKNDYPPAVKAAIADYAKDMGIPVDEMHISEAYGVAVNGGRTQLCGDYFAVSDGKLFNIKKLEKPSEFTFKYEAETAGRESLEALKSEYPFYCDLDKISGEVTVRSRAKGDEITLAKRGVTKSLKKLMNELKIPEEERPRVPIICDAHGVIGVYGYAISERVYPDTNTQNYYLLKISVEDII